MNQQGQIIRQRGGEAVVWVSGQAKQDLRKMKVAARYASAVVGETVMLSMYPRESHELLALPLAALKEIDEAVEACIREGAKYVIAGLDGQAELYLDVEGVTGDGAQGRCMTGR